MSQHPPKTVADSDPQIEVDEASGVKEIGYLQLLPNVSDWLETPTQIVEIFDEFHGFRKEVYFYIKENYLRPIFEACLQKNTNLQNLANEIRNTLNYSLDQMSGQEYQYCLPPETLIQLRIAINTADWESATGLVALRDDIIKILRLKPQDVI